VADKDGLIKRIDEELKKFELSQETEEDVEQ
jgi:hypothetical protein